MLCDQNYLEYKNYPKAEIKPQFKFITIGLVLPEKNSVIFRSLEFPTKENLSHFFNELFYVCINNLSSEVILSCKYIFEYYPPFLMKIYFFSC